MLLNHPDSLQPVSAGLLRVADGAHTPSPNSKKIVKTEWGNDQKVKMSASLLTAHAPILHKKPKAPP